MKNGLFSENSNYNEIKKTILNNIDKTFNTTDLEFISKGMNAFNKLEENERILSYSKDADKLCSDNSINIFNKIPIILSGSIIINDYKEKAKEMTNEELFLLSYYSLTGDIDFYNKLFTSGLLRQVCKKSNDFKERYNFLEVIEDSYEMFYDTMNDDNALYIRKNLEKFSERLGYEEFKFLYEALNQRIINQTDKKGITL